MSVWPSAKATRVRRALAKIGWTDKLGSTKRGSHQQPVHEERGEYTKAMHDSDEIGPKMLARVAKRTGLKPENL